MKKRMFLKSVVVLTLLLLPGLALAFDPVTDCPSMVTASSMSDVTTALDNYASYLKDGNYVICFEVDSRYPIPVTSVLGIAGKDKPLVIYGLKLMAGVSGRPAVTYTGVLASVTGPNITLRDWILNETINPLSITGSNVQLIDSTITATQTGISISGGENVNILGTTIVGNNSAGSIGINISGADTILIGTDSLSTNTIDLNNAVTISNFNTQINAAASSPVKVSGMTFENVAVTDQNLIDVTKLISGTGDLQVDINKVGKKIDDSGAVARIAGKAPAGITSCDTSSSVELYLASTSTATPEVFYTPSCTIDSNGNRICTSSCAVYQTTDDTEFCIYKGTGIAPSRDDCAKMDVSECECFNTGTCVFDCQNLEIAAEQQSRNVLFTYTEASGKTNKFSDYKLMSELGGIIATLAPTVPLEAGGLTGTDGDGGNNVVEVGGGGEDGGGSGPSLGLAKGCSLVPERDGRRIPAFAGMTGLTAIPPFAIILLVTLAAPVVVRIRIKKN